MATAAERTRCGHATVGVMGGGAMQVQKRRLAVRLCTAIHLLYPVDTRYEIKKKMASGAPTAVLALMLLLSHVDTHSIGFGSCRTAPPMSGFDVTKYLGKWYINEISSHITNCLVLFFEQNPDVPNEIKATQSREFPFHSTFGMHHVSNYTGTIVKGDASNPAAMSIKWPASSRIIGSMSYTVIDTDYTHYALTYECASIGGLLRYYSPSILSRDATLDPTLLQRAKDAANTAGVDLSDLRPVSHGNCAQQGDDSTPASNNTFNFNVLGLISDQKLHQIETQSELIQELEFPEKTWP